jgi:uncharacterized surface protein with fasciclin (FAS1) repeats
MKNLAISFVTSVSLLAACGDNEDPVDPGDNDDDPGELTIVGTAQATSDLSTLVAVLDFASENGDLVALLSEPGSFTVFAPTNAAFDALAVELTGNAGAAASDLLTAQNKPLLRTVLQYHVLTSEVTAGAIPFGSPITTAEGSIFKIDTGSPPMITDGRNRTAKITATDIDTSNGVVHLIDRVILPADKDLVATAQATPELSILVEAVVAADLVGAISAPGPFTVFAPTNAAFAALLAELGVTKAQLLANKPLLTSVLAYHVVPGLVLEADAPIGAPVTTLETGTFSINENLAITDERGRTAQIMATDVLAKNGVVHVIDRVILPAQ